jgi:ATP-dependent RNA helicase DeaD
LLIKKIRIALFFLLIKELKTLKFSELNINHNIQRALQKKGFSEPSEIQAKVIPAALKGHDIVGKSQTGTGKTAAFAVPLVAKTVRGQMCSSLVVVPTRELAKQVKEEIASIAEGSRIRTVAVFGGQDIKKQIGLLHKKPEIVVGTPGRLFDLIARKVLWLNRTNCLVLDEADKMFDMGFREDVRKIISFLPHERHILLFSATLPEAINHLIDQHLKPERLVFDLSVESITVKEVEQYYIMIDPRQKIDALRQLIDMDKSKTLVFCRTKRTVDWLERQLYRRGVRAMAIHGDRAQNARERIIDKFKRSKDGILIATDVVARGIHVNDIDKVVNFDLPQEEETYIHRIGRTARQGRRGRAITFCGSVMELEDLERVGAKNNTTIHPLN